MLSLLQRHKNYIQSQPRPKLPHGYCPYLFLELHVSLYQHSCFPAFVSPAKGIVRVTTICILRYTGCLVTNTPFPSFIFTFRKNNQLQNIQTFFTFYITSIIFYYYSNKKIHYNTKFFHFQYKFFLLYITSITSYY
jgi:hypothetical protein